MNGETISAARTAEAKPDAGAEADLDPKPEAKPQRRGWLWAGLGLLAAGGLAGYGIWSRSTATADLTKSTDDSALPRVQVASPKNGPQERNLTLPGNMARTTAAASPMPEPAPVTMMTLLVSIAAFPVRAARRGCARARRL